MADQHIVLQLQLVDLLLRFALRKQLLGLHLYIFVPQRAVFFIRLAVGGQGVDHLADRALMQFAFVEPLVVLDTVFREIFPHILDVFRQRKRHERRTAFRFALLQERVAVKVGEFLCARRNIRAVIAVLRQLGRVFSQKQLLIANVQRKAEFVNLVARVVDIKFPRNAVPRHFEHRREAVAKRAAARIAHMHRAGRVGGHKFHHNLFPLAVIAAAVIPA